jgi:archaellum component FlaF (FlaF/FlaG flagellin family)
VYGELAINYTDGKIYYKNSSNAISEISGGNGGGTSSTDYLSNANYRFDSGAYNHTGTALAVVDQFSASTYRSCRYQIQITTSITYHICEISVLHNGTTAYVLKTNDITLPGASGVFTADIMSGQVRLKFTPAQNHETSSLVFTRTLLVNTGDIMFGDLMIQSGTEDLMLGTGIIDLMAEDGETNEGDLMSELGTEEDLMLGTEIVDLMN